MNTAEPVIKLFISHSKADVELAEILVDTIKEYFDIPDEKIRCTSLPGYQLRGGVNIAAALQTELRNAQAVIGILTPNSLASPWVLCELGAAWGLVKNFIPVLAGVDPEKVTGPLGVLHAWSMREADQIHSALQDLEKHLGEDAPRRHLTKKKEDKALKHLVSYAKKYDPDTIMVPAANLFSFHSSKNPNKSSNVFQDFDVSRNHGINANAIKFFWADSFTNSSIRASIISELHDKYLRIWFENGIRSQDQGEHAKGWASNIEIRPQNQGALGNEREPGHIRYPAVQFFARIPMEEKGDDYLAEVGLSLRILDRRLTYWVYTGLLENKNPSQFRICGTDWQPVRFELKPECYKVYTADGNRWYLKYGSEGEAIPDFTVLTGITLVLGKFTAGREEPQEGKGVVDIKAVTLVE